MDSTDPTMDSIDAREQLATVAAAEEAASTHRLPLSLGLAGALLVAAGIVLLGRPAEGFTFLAERLVALALLATAAALPALHRRRRGLFGYAGRSRQMNFAYVVVVAALFSTGADADRTLSRLYVAFGVVLAVTYLVTLTRVPGLARVPGLTRVPGLRR